MLGMSKDIKSFQPALGKYKEISIQKQKFQSPFSRLNPSHASFSVANTAALIIFCSVEAVGGSYMIISKLAKRRKFASGMKSYAFQAQVPQSKVPGKFRDKIEEAHLPYQDAPCQSPAYKQP